MPFLLEAPSRKVEGLIRTIDDVAIVAGNKLTDGHFILAEEPHSHVPAQVFDSTAPIVQDLRKNRTNLRLEGL